MTPITRRFVALSLLYCLLVPQQVWADPCGMVPPISLTRAAPELTRVGDQITYVFFSQGIEDMVLRPAFEGSVHEFGMLIPFPSPPEIRKVSDDIFTHLAHAVEPPEIVVDMQIRELKRMRGRLRAMTAAPVMDLAYSVKVLKEEAVGMYQVAVLEAENPLALKAWMETHGYVYPQGMDSVCQEYIDSGWCFVAVKANVGSKPAVEPHPGMRSVDPKLPSIAKFSGAVQAMGFRFRVDQPVVPMRLSAFNPGELHNIVYILSDQPTRINQLDPGMVKMQIPGARLYRNLTEPLPVRVIGGTIEQAEKAGYFNRPQFDRDPSKKNGKARELFMSDLLACRDNRLIHPFETRQKELLKIGERLGLRGEEVDSRIADVVNEGRQLASKDILETLKDFTLTVVEGDFPREVIAAQNLTFSSYTAQKKDVRHGSVTPKRDNAYATSSGVGTTVSWIACCSLLGLCVVGGRRRKFLVLLALCALGSVWVSSSLTAQEPILPTMIEVEPQVANDPRLKLPIDILYSPKLNVPRATQDLELDVKRLADSAAAEAAAARLIAQGPTAVPHLIQEVQRGSDIASRGWAVVCLADIGDVSALDPMRETLSAPGTPELLKLWIGGALLRLRGAEGVTELLGTQIVHPQRKDEVAAVLLGLQGGAVRPLVEVALRGESVPLRRLATGYLGALEGRLKGGLVRTVMAEALKFDRERAKAGVPWSGGALFLPRYSWPREEALRLAVDLTCWMVHAEKTQDHDTIDQVRNNLRDLSWRIGVPWRNLGGGADWTRSLLAAFGRVSSAVPEDASPDMLLLVLELLRDQTPATR